MISKFYEYAGIVGVASVAGWVLAWVFGLTYAAGLRRVAFCRAALDSGNR